MTVEWNELSVGGLNLPDAYAELLISDGNNYRRAQLEPFIRDKIIRYGMLHADDLWTDLECIRAVETPAESMPMTKWKYWMCMPKVD